MKPEWRNWQTRQVEGLVPVKGVQVQVLSPALKAGQGVTARAGFLALIVSVATRPSPGPTNSLGRKADKTFSPRAWLTTSAERDQQLVYGKAL